MDGVLGPDPQLVNRYENRIHILLNIGVSKLILALACPWTVAGFRSLDSTLLKTSNTILLQGKY